MDFSPAFDLELQLEGFNGPLDLLLHLVRKQKMAISDIAIAPITEQYAEYLKRMEELNLDIAGDYFVMASTLMLMKAKSLIPREKESFEEMREDLIFQLEEYEKIVAQAAELQKLHREAVRSFPRVYKEKIEKAEREFKVGENAIFLLVEHYARVIERRKALRPILIKPKPYTMKDVLSLLFGVFRKRKSTRFSSLTHQRERGFVVYLFVSVLELVREGSLKVTQTDTFSEIILQRRGVFTEEKQQQLIARFE
ncbi:MAG: segregation/condensation protein A [Acidobacteria bacterium]|nr:segregation/condensation protein A [Acidobacteriota bacterium]